ncbi:ATP-dependent zinc protease family protein [Agarivorans sp. QJM3NY_25]|uniref:ATP-dependent zinc protease family protein n=1 Tax=Agarivorans sp. QJM3NY_25 TaxID=3421430 RepID=UPI003D7CBDB2
MLKKILFAMVFTLASASSCWAEKATVGALEYIRIVEADLRYLTRIDTGAASTSLHADHIRVIDGNNILPADYSEAEQKSLVKPKMRANIGKYLEFTTINEQGEQHQGKARISDVVAVRNSQGLEIRYKVALAIEWQGQQKTVDVNLRDRSKMDYKLLIGRDWLEGDYLVDVERNKQLP